MKDLLAILKWLVIVLLFTLGVVAIVTGFKSQTSPPSKEKIYYGQHFFTVWCTVCNTGRVVTLSCDRTTSWPPPNNEITNTPLVVLLEPIQAEAGRRGDNYTAAAINFLQAAIVAGKQREFALQIAPYDKNRVDCHEETTKEGS